VRRTCLIVLFAALCIDTWAASALAQLFPGRRHYSSYDAYDYDAAVGAAALIGSNAAARGTAQAFQAWGQQPTQMSATQGAIRGTIDADAQRRLQGDYGQQQANRDWWFQVQQQQVAERRTTTSSSPAVVDLSPSVPSAPSPSPSAGDSASVYNAPASMGFESTPYVPPVTSSVIRWLPVLCAPQFDQQRAKIEAPYRRKTDGQRLSNPTPEDYRNMIEAAAKMKTILQGMKADVSPQDYIDAVAFLDQLSTEARSRVPK
jgi:hypothetical protein